MNKSTRPALKTSDSKTKRQNPLKQIHRYQNKKTVIGGTTFEAHLVKNVEFRVPEEYGGLYKLGEGTYGSVAAARVVASRKKVAIKKVADFTSNLDDGMRILREIKLLRHLDNLNIIKLVDVFGDRNLDDVYLVFDRMEYNLHDVIQSKATLTEDHVKYIVWSILCGILYMHSAGIIHRDLKPANVLINIGCEFGDVKICDLGLSRGEAASGVELTEYVVTRWYRAPEVMLSPGAYGQKMDVWAVGCIMAEILGRKPLFEGANHIEQIDLMLKQLGTPEDDDLEYVTNEGAISFMKEQRKYKKTDWSTTYPNASKDALDLLDKMLHMNPKKRISVAEALEHPYVQSVSNSVYMTNECTTDKSPQRCEKKNMRTNVIRKSTHRSKTCLLQKTT
uniref:Protein kinase domain-containing protein n=2 Tax=Lotharella globosa TaxID=91324 RepID=A0A7S4E1I0_9EUKA